MKQSKSAKRASNRPGQTPAPPAVAVPRAKFVAGIIFLLLSALFSLALVVQHLGGLDLPGCGEGGACEQAANSFWGSVRIGSFAWPVSYLGLAWFVAALVTWLVTHGAVPRVFRYVVRFGALVSLGFCALIVVKNLPCPYCIAAHLGNFAFWITLELSRAVRPNLRLTAATALGTFAGVSLLLGIADARRRADVIAAAESERAETTRQMIAAGKRAGESATQATAVPPPVTATATAPTTTQSAPSPAASSQAAVGNATQAATTAPATTSGFTGRYRLGPEKAAIRIVMITDYQCPDCYDIEQQLEQLLKERDDISVSIKHFPFNQECNPVVKKNLHANACWAARAAEAAGILWGDEGYFKLHFWLFQRKGLFETTQQLEDGIRSLGYNPQGFIDVMAGPEPLRRIQEDAREAQALGLYYTPMIFINGIEMKGIRVPNALLKTVRELAATNPPPATAANDRPPNAFERYIADWREESPRNIVADKSDWARGQSDAKLRIVVFGDYTEPNTAQADTEIRAFLESHPDAYYSFRHFPFDQNCNKFVNESKYPLGCRASRAAEAAGQLGGREAYWNMHAWLIENSGELNDALLNAIAPTFGLDPGALLAKMDSAEVTAAIANDTEAGRQAALRSIPMIIVDGKLVPRWTLSGQNVLGAVLTEAAAD